MGTRRSFGTFAAVAVSTPYVGHLVSSAPAGVRIRHWPARLASATGQWRPGLAGGAVPAASLGSAGAPQTRPGRTVTAVLCSFDPAATTVKGTARGGLPRRLRRLGHGTVESHHGPHPARDQSRSVRAGSARHREPLVINGHQRSRPAYRNRRSQGTPAPNLGERNSETAGSSPSARSSPAPRDVAHIASPSSGLPEIAVRTLVSKRVKGPKHQTVLPEAGGGPLVSAPALPAPDAGRGPGRPMRATPPLSSPGPAAAVDAERVPLVGGVAAIQWAYFAPMPMLTAFVRTARRFAPARSRSMPSRT
jgi:hypothetical protein